MQHLLLLSRPCFFCLLILLPSLSNHLPISCSLQTLAMAQLASSLPEFAFKSLLAMAISASILQKMPSSCDAFPSTTTVSTLHHSPGPPSSAHADESRNSLSCAGAGCDHTQILAEEHVAVVASSSRQVLRTVKALNTLKTLDMASSRQDAAVSTSTTGEGKIMHPQIFFEITAPLDPSPPSPCASLHIFSHSFANSYSLPPAMANYTPPPGRPHTCDNPSQWSLIVLTWSGSSVGRQFDRIAAVWFGGVEFLRTCTAEPTKQGIYWEVKKDVTKYSSLLAKPQPIVVELGNLVTDKLTGVFHINLTLDFFSASSHVSRDRHGKPQDRPADLVVPISAPSPLPDGHWFHISSDSDIAGRSFSVPANVYKAVLEVYVSFHGDDEFWYTNPPNEYIANNNLTGVPGNGAFREVQARLDGRLVAAIWPFPVVYTGGIINLYWRPAAAIGAFDLPTYEFDLSPFVGSLTSTEQHSIEFRVEDAIGNWFIDGAFHLWLDEKLTQTSGRLISYEAPPHTTSLRSDFKGLDGTFHTTASRKLSYSGVVVWSAGNHSVSSSYALKFDNMQVYINNSALQSISQRIDTQAEIRTETPSEVVRLQQSSYSFPLDLSCFSYDGANSSLVLNCNLSHAFDKQVYTVADQAESSSELLNNNQQGQGEIVIVNSTVVAGVGALQQHYRAEGSHKCYQRELSTKNYTILSDKSSRSCSIKSWRT